ncbi:MAG TPA: aminoglycoside phosphotransferase, partial [Acidimicrobiaceae bacterium]|nr:aminoglycoside phosphotransferase [Acidimicrobiaceae bacterium]
MTNQNFPTGVDEVTPAWLTSVLRSAGGLDSGSVTGFEAELIGQGIGIMGLLHRLRPTYDGGSGPETVILKSPVQDEGTRFVARTFMFYGKEVAFYRTAADDSPLTTPRCFAADHDSENDEFVLLLEDLADAEVAS